MKLENNKYNKNVLNETESKERQTDQRLQLQQNLANRTQFVMAIYFFT